MTTQCAQKLKLAQMKTSVSIQGIGAKQAGTATKEVQFEMRPRFTSNVRIHGLAYILKQLTDIRLTDIRYLTAGSSVFTSADNAPPHQKCVSCITE